MKLTQADSEIEEEHLLNFVVNRLDEELAIDLGENVEVTTETLYENWRRLIQSCSDLFDEAWPQPFENSQRMWSYDRTVEIEKSWLQYRGGRSGYMR